MIARVSPNALGGHRRRHRFKIGRAPLNHCIRPLADAPTHVICNTTCDDIEATARCLEALGGSRGGHPRRLFW